MQEHNLKEQKDKDAKETVESHYHRYPERIRNTEVKVVERDDVLSFGQIVGIILQHPLLEISYTITFGAEIMQE